MTVLVNTSNKLPDPTKWRDVSQESALVVGGVHRSRGISAIRSHYVTTSEDITD
jgi:hypothetical protein